MRFEGVIKAGEVEDDLVVANNDLLGTGVLSGKGVLEDGLVIFSLQCDKQEERAGFGKNKEKLNRRSRTRRRGREEEREKKRKDDDEVNLQSLRLRRTDCC